jgi:hypothetical protein
LKVFGRAARAKKNVVLLFLPRLNRLGARRMMLGDAAAAAAAKKGHLQWRRPVAVAACQMLLWVDGSTVPIG